MFWAYNATSPQIDIILCKEDLTLQELLDQENVLQELKAQNLKLIEFLIKPEILLELVSLITTEPSSDLDETEQYRFPNLACELLTSDLPALNERLASEEILNKLYNFLENDPPLNPLLASYFSRTLSVVISRKTEQNWYSYQYTCLKALEFLKGKENFIELLLKHMGTSSIMDLMYNLITLIEGQELKQTLRSWIQTQDVIPKLIGLLSPHADADCQVNVASVLGNIIPKLRENVADLNEKPESDPVLNILESSQIIELILSIVFDCDILTGTSVECAIGVLLALIQPHLPGEPRCRQMLHYTVHDKMDSGLVIHNSFPETEQTKNHESVVLNAFIVAILPYVKKMREILKNPVRMDPIKLTSGLILHPFGKSRLFVAKFVAILISLNNTEINKEIIHCDIPELLLDLFYAYSNNNFLHTEVEKLIAYAVDNMDGYTVTECNDDLFLTHLLKKCYLLKKILGMWKENSIRENEEGLYRRGYMGHIIRIASIIHIENEKKSVFHELLQKEVDTEVLEEWREFVDETLKSIIEKHSSCLGGVRPKSCQSSDNSFEEAAYKGLKSNFKDFDQENDQNAMFTNDASIIPYNLNNDITDEEEDKQTEMFHVICAQKWQSFNKGLDNLDDNEDEENDPIDIWKNKDKSSSGMGAWDSDDENLEADPWSKLGNSINPWVNTSIESDSTEWNKNSNSDWANFEENFESMNTEQNNGNEECSTLTTNAAESYSLFGNVGNEKPDLLNNFSNVRISNDQFNSQLQNGGKIKNEEWNEEWCVTDENVKVENQNNSYKIQNEYNCYEEHGKDSSDVMLNLESICGNTLAEKIANAENDIRNKDEILMRGIREQTALKNNFHFTNVTTEEINKNECGCQNKECDDEIKETDIEEFSEVKSTQEQMFLSVSQSDYLTENSADFVTAENSTSDVESYIEFGDAENSLELEVDEFMAYDKIDENGDVESGLRDSHEIFFPNEILSENVPTNDINEKYNKHLTESKKEHAISDKSHFLVNGDVNHKKLEDCDKSENSLDICSQTKEQFDKNANDAVIEEPA